MKIFKKGFEKRASALTHAAEIAGLGILAAPSIQRLRHKPMSESGASRAEVAGLGILAAPSVAQFIKPLIKRASVNGK